MERLEDTILKNLLYNDDFVRKSLPYLKNDYFLEHTDKILFEEINKFILKYNVSPTKESLIIELNENTKLQEDQFKDLVERLSVYDNAKNEKPETDWLLDSTEQFCQDKAIYNAVLESIAIIDGQQKTEKDKGAIPSILSDALAVCFDPNIGHDYIEDAEERYESYHQVEQRIPFDLEYFNKITNGGLPNKTLNIAIAGTGVGKSLFMCHMASSCLSQGHNVLYITLEMAEEKIAERIDANLMNITLDDLKQLPKDLYERKVASISKVTDGKLIVKEYPTAAANTNHFRNLLSELKLKRQFIPQIIFIDYLNICSSARLKQGANVNSYTFIKSIAEELRGMAVEYDVPIVSATQTTRSGFSSTDVGLEDTSESFGLPATADLMFALISTEELEGLSQMLVKQLKNRYNDPTSSKRFVIGIDRAKMKLYDLEDSAQDDLIDRMNDKKTKKGKFNAPWNEQENDEPAFDKATGGKMKNKKEFAEFNFS
tara:strand:+ start:128 stop:1585 length:1458 start_codon:yes stop_codon:yes gene_type:complete